MATFELLKTNLLSPLVLAFILGIITKLAKSDFRLPRDLYSSLSIYLLLALGLKGGVELAESSFDAIAWPAAVTIALGCITPISAYFLIRKICNFSKVDAAALAAHYGSVSAVTFIAATQFIEEMGLKAEGFMPTLLTLLESPGIHIALAIGALGRSHSSAGKAAGLASSTQTTSAEVAPDTKKTTGEILHEILTAQSMILLVGGLIIGFLITEKHYHPIQPFFESGFKGALVLFLLEMGIVAGSRIEDLKKVGLKLISLGIVIPIVHGLLGVWLGHLAGLSVGGATVLGTMAASASYIAAPPAVRMTLPEANPTYYLTASLAVTFPFNLVFGIPMFFKFAQYLGA